jgi:iron complex transport system substrate-binding protein
MESGEHDRLREITAIIVDAAVDIHRDLGPGLLESAYEAILACELRARGLRVRRQVDVRFTYRGNEIDDGFRIDLLVEECVVVELKSAFKRDAAFAKQLLTYLRILDSRVGLLLNFGLPLMKQGIERVVNDRPYPSYLSVRIRGESTSP